MPNIRAIVNDSWRETVRAKYFKMPHTVSQNAITVYMS